MGILSRLTGGPLKMLTRRNSTLPNYQTLTLTSPKEYVVHVQLNRPTKLNAINRTMWEEIGQCFNALSNNPDCRVIVLSGAGDKVFCAGIDFSDFMGLATKLAEHEDIARKCAVLWPTIKLYQESITAVEKCHKPVISAVHGACIGGGVDLICATDMRYCSKDAWFQVKEVDIGMAADVGVLQRMPKAMGSRSLVNELAYTCRKFPALEAKETGFVNHVYETKESLLEGALGIAKTIADKSPVAVQGTKRSLIYSRDHTVEEGLEHIALYNMTMLQSEDFLNATASQISKSDPPVFSKL
ncbi:UNVERIFIED_CONTAM: hypothetical protein PYX00_006221 [Menopon gallinae]|uniref:Delta(3,5)-Delta(2,4)-dienoyl-CoA isomerase, mitochondrial n=1 Tax=Menopon gallinae TaxID=328185 RepID=A0AAW2HUM1_9NEOP